jgi:hypothetical protein
MLSLATLDGADDAAPAGSFEPPGGAMPASIGPAPTRPPRPKDEPLDLFAPPETQGGEPALELAIDEPALRAPAPTPPPQVIDPGPTSSDRQRSATPPSSPVLRPRPQSQPAATVPIGVVVTPPARWRFAAGILLAVMLGFLPAHVVASIREQAAFDAIDERVVEIQAQVGSRTPPVPYAELDAFRDEQLDAKRAARRNITLLGFAIWGVGGAAIGFAWFRYAPWGRA